MCVDRSSVGVRIAHGLCQKKAPLVRGFCIRGNSAVAELSFFQECDIRRTNNSHGVDSFLWFWMQKKCHERFFGWSRTNCEDMIGVIQAPVRRCMETCFLPIGLIEQERSLRDVVVRNLE